MEQMVEQRGKAEEVRGEVPVGIGGELDLQT
jgi:hypothetical protein